jgi:hypothetical protein
MGLIAGSYAENDKQSKMQEVFEQMLQIEKPNACKPIPIYRRSPKVVCPRCGTDGVLLVKYDILPNGTVDGVEVLSEDLPKGAKKDIFAAFEDWRYYPAVENGQPVTTHGQKVQFSLIGGAR